MVSFIQLCRIGSQAYLIKSINFEHIICCLIHTRNERTKKRKKYCRILTSYHSAPPWWPKKQFGPRRCRRRHWHRRFVRRHSSASSFHLGTIPACIVCIPHTAPPEKHHVVLLIRRSKLALAYGCTVADLTAKTTTKSTKKNEEDVHVWNCIAAA